jgi:DNA mismatch repair protein MSH3
LRQEHYTCNHVRSSSQENSAARLKKSFLISPLTRTIIVLRRLTNRNTYTETIRTEHVARPKTTDLAITQIKQFYESVPDVTTTLLDKILAFPRLTLLSLAALITYTLDFGLQNVFTSKYFQHFSSRAHMLLNGSTISSLEIYRNQTDFSEKGSLFWVLDHTRTKFGRRLLRKWIGRPLLARELSPVNVDDL